MEISIKKEELQKKSIFIATPMYGGMNHGLYAKACLDLQAICMQYGVQVKFSFLFNESLITRARNYLVDEFLHRSDCTHMLFIDADIHFNPQDVLALLALDKDVIGGPYPKKAIKWSSVKKALTKNPDMEAGDLEKVTGDFKREVFPKFAEAFPQLRYKPDHVGQAHFDGTRYIHAYFDTLIDTKDSATGGGSDRYLSEDYMFCQLWRKIGGSIWLCPWMRADHIGTYHFRGDMPAVANFVGEM